MNKNTTILHNDFLGRGDFVVATIQSTNVIEKAAISFFRLWCDGTVSRKEIERNLTISLGYLRGYKSSKAIHDFCALLFHEGSKPFSIQMIDDDFISADENCLSKFILYTFLGNDNEAENIVSMFFPRPLCSKLLLSAKDVCSVFRDLRLDISQ